MLIATALGVCLGLMLLGSVDDKLTSAVLNLVLSLWSAFSYVAPNLRLPLEKERPTGIISGIATGIIKGLTGSQVIPCMPYLMAPNLDRNIFIQATNISITLSSLIMAISLIHLELLTLDAIKFSIIGLFLILLDLQLGTKIRSQ